MYIINATEILPESKIYRCKSRLIAEYLIYQKSIPLLSKNGKDWIFTRNDVLEEVLKNLPFWLKVTCKF
jgi:hypothetical protein